MDNMQRQMDMFEEGGLRDEGGMVDEESGNEVPIGSTRKEVRDDIPAQISEGEFVFPADVVRFLGLEKLMEMRQAAKMGLKQMEAMGQMGNSDEATIPDDMPFGMADLVVISGPDEDDKPQKKAEGGLAFASGGISMPDFDFSNQDVRIYVKEGSPDRRIPFFNGEPVIPIPAGYVLKGSTPVKEETETEKAIPTGGDDDDRPPVKQSEFQEAGGWDMDFGNPPDASKVDLWIKEAEKTVGYGPTIATGVAAAFGGPLAAFVYLGNKMNAKGRDAGFAKALAAAKKTATPGQVDKLNAISKTINEGADKNILEKGLDAISKALGFNQKQKATATKVSGNASSSLEKNKNKIAAANRESGLDQPSKYIDEKDLEAMQAVIDQRGDTDGPQSDEIENIENAIAAANRELGLDQPSEYEAMQAVIDQRGDTEGPQFDEIENIENVIAASNRELGLDQPSEYSGADTPDITSDVGPEAKGFTSPSSSGVSPDYGITKEVFGDMVGARVGDDLNPAKETRIGKDKTTASYNNQNYKTVLEDTIGQFNNTYDKLVEDIRYSSSKATSMKGKTVLKNELNEQAESYFDTLKQGLGFEGPLEVNEKIRDDGSTEPFTPKVDKPDSDDPLPPTVPTSSSAGDNNKTAFSDRDRPNLSNVGNLQGQSTEEKTKAVALKTDNLSPTEKTGGAALDTAMGISGLSRGGLAGRRKKK
jgi:hypothetical protein